MAFYDRALLARDRANTQLAKQTFASAYTVTVRLELYSGPIGEGVTALTPTSTLTLAPRPKVQSVGADEATFFGGNGFRSDAFGDFRVTVLHVSGIVAAYDTGTITGGYTEAQLMPAPTGVNQRSAWLITGPGLRSTGEPFEIVTVNMADPLDWQFTVRRAAVIALPYP
jgi:hypothetical protein